MPSAFHGILATTVPILQMGVRKTEWIVGGLTGLMMPKLVLLPPASWER